MSGWLRRLEGGRRLEERATLGLFRPNTVEARDRSGEPPSAMETDAAKAASFIARGPSEGGRSGRAIGQSAVVGGGAWSRRVTNQEHIGLLDPPPRPPVVGKSRACRRGLL